MSVFLAKLAGVVRNTEKTKILLEIFLTPTYDEEFFNGAGLLWFIGLSGSVNKTKEF